MATLASVSGCKLSSTRLAISRMPGFLRFLLGYGSIFMPDGMHGKKRLRNLYRDAAIRCATVALRELIPHIATTHHRILAVQAVARLAHVLVETPQHASLPVPPSAPQSRQPFVSSLAIASLLPYFCLHSKSLRAFEVSLYAYI